MMRLRSLAQRLGGVKQAGYRACQCGWSLLLLIKVFNLEQIDAVVADFGLLKERIPGIVAYEWGSNVSPEGLNQGYTHCSTLALASENDRDAYLVHPAHQAFVDTLGACLEKSLVVDYWAQQAAPAPPSRTRGPAVRPAPWPTGA